MIVLVAVLVVFLGLFLMVALRRNAPDIPADDLHLPVRGDAGACMTCHGPDQAMPRGPNHPFGMDCWRCHYEAGEAR